MKKFFLLSVLFAFTLHTFSQSKDLIKLANGDFLGMNAVLDSKDNLFGYVSIYGYGKSGDKTKKFEYVILDKNLNPVANKEFDGDITASDYSAFMDFKGQIILRPTALDYSLIKSKDMFSPSAMVIDVAKNEIKKKVYFDYDDNKFIEINEQKNWKENKKENKSEKKKNGYIYESNVFEIKEGGYLVTEYDDYGSFIKNNSIKRFDENKNELWQYKYNTSGDKNKSEVFRFIEKDEKHIYAFLKKKNKKDITFSLVVLDIKSGEVLHDKIIENVDLTVLDYIQGFGYIDNSKTFDDNIVFLGANYKKNNPQSIGFTRLTIDKKNFDVEVKYTNYENDLDKFIPKLDKYGGVEGSYLLIAKDLFFLKNGSIGILLEKYKPQGQYSASKSTDLVYVYTDKDFKVSGVQVFEKEKTKWNHSDYLFSQYLNDGNDVVFFYKDRQKDEETNEKNWNLFINTLINGTFKQEIVPISSKENMIFPYIAKEGYIMLQEYNKKDKYNNIRLERLNY